MAEETLYTAQTGLASISTANSNLDGTGTVDQILQAFGSEGSIIKSISIKATGTTTEGMIRLYTDVTAIGTYSLFAEINVPPVTPSSIDPSFEWHQELDMDIGNACIIGASTQKAETFHIITEAMGRSYNNAYEVRTDTTQYTANTGIVTISTANSNRDGTGTLGSVLTAGASASGCKIYSITIKAIQSTTKGMVRLYIESGFGGTKLFKEIPVPAVTKTSASDAFEHTIVFEDGYNIEASAILWASTEKGEFFKITANAVDWSYLP